MRKTKEDTDRLKKKGVRASGVCYQCAMPIPDVSTMVCPRCGSMDVDPRRSRPRKMPPRDVDALPYPWQDIRFEPGGTCLLSGNRGSGKTTVSIELRPSRYCSSEQEPEKVASMWYRQHPDGPEPSITSCTSWEELDEDTSDINEKSLVVVDSISQLGESDETTVIMRECVRRVRRSGARAIFVAQYTKDGQILGPNELQHVVDIVVEIPPNAFGTRTLATTKNRFGRLSTTYFEIGNKGITRPNFPYAYSVEGTVGDYRLHLYPMGKAVYADVIAALHEAGIQIDNIASSAVHCSMYKAQYAEPPDVQERRTFALQHGLRWVSPELAAALLAQPAHALEIMDNEYPPKETA